MNKQEIIRSEFNSYILKETSRRAYLELPEQVKESAEYWKGTKTYFDVLESTLKQLNIPYTRESDTSIDTVVPGYDIPISVYSMNKRPWTTVSIDDEWWINNRPDWADNPMHSMNSQNRYVSEGTFKYPFPMQPSNGHGLSFPFYNFYLDFERFIL